MQLDSSLVWEEGSTVISSPVTGHWGDGKQIVKSAQKGGCFFNEMQVTYRQYF